MAQILPDDLRPVDTKRPSEGLQTVTNYIHYMRERIEFSLGSMRKAVGSVVDEKLASIDAPNDGKTYGRKDGEWVEVSGGSGGVSDYSDLTNKPQLGGHTIASGNNSYSSLGIQPTISDLNDIRSGAVLGSTALQPGDNISELTNDAGYVTEDIKIQGVVNQSETLVLTYINTPISI